MTPIALHASLLLLTSNVLAADLPLGRVSDLEGRLFVRGQSDTEQLLLTVNAVLRPGDSLAVPAGSRAELELSGAGFLRLGGGSQLDLETEEGRVIAILHDGAVTASRNNVPGTTIDLVGLGVRVALEPDALVRLDVERDRALGLAQCREGRVSVWLGEVEERLVAGDGLRFWPGSRQRLAGSELLFDALDTWNAARHRLVRRVPESPEGEMLGAWELTNHGEWLVVDGLRSFRPAVPVAWRPYQVGGWAWVEPWGWVWTPTASWEFVTHHYGRWRFHQTHGWLWLPAPGWGPAFVAWTVAGPYAGWAPLDPWGHTPFYTATWQESAAWWFFVELAYFFDGGGCPGHGHDTVIVDVDVTTIAVHAPEPADANDDLPPAESPRAVGRDRIAELRGRRAAHREELALQNSTAPASRLGNPPRLVLPTPRSRAAANPTPAVRLADRPSYAGVSTAASPAAAPPNASARSFEPDPVRRPVAVPSPRTPTRTPTRTRSAAELPSPRGTPPVAARPEPPPVTSRPSASSSSRPPASPTPPAVDRPPRSAPRSSTPATSPDRPTRRSTATTTPAAGQSRSSPSPRSSSARSEPRSSSRVQAQSSPSRATQSAPSKPTSPPPPPPKQESRRSESKEKSKESKAARR